MKKTVIAAIIASGLAFTALPSYAQNSLTGVPPIAHQIELDNAQSEFFTVEVKGNAYERGFQHGKALRKVIRPAVNRFKYDLVTPLLENLGLKTTYAEYQKFFMEETGLLKTAKEQAPKLVEEIRGIADGAGLSFDEVFAYNLNFDETFWVIEKMTGIDPIMAMEKAQQAHVDGHCSHGSVWGNGKASVGYTLDWVRQFEGTQALIKHELPNGDVLLTTTYAGTLIGHGINATHGYTFTPHSKFQIEHDVDHGLAQIFVYRKLLQAGSVDKAITYLKTLHPAAGLGYALTDKNGTRTFEVSKNNIAEFKTDGNWMAVANVARANNDLSSTYLEELKLEQGKVDMSNLPKQYWQLNKDSVKRFDLIKKDIKGKTPEQMTAQKWEQTFVKYPINKPVNEELATSNLWQVVEIDGEYITYHVSPGNPGNLPLETYRFKYQ